MHFFRGKDNRLHPERLILMLFVGMTMLPVQCAGLKCYSCKGLPCVNPEENHEVDCPSGYCLEFLEKDATSATRQCVMGAQLIPVAKCLAHLGVCPVRDIFDLFTDASANQTKPGEAQSIVSCLAMEAMGMGTVSTVVGVTEILTKMAKELASTIRGKLKVRQFESFSDIYKALEMCGCNKDLCNDKLRSNNGTSGSNGLNGKTSNALTSLAILLSVGVLSY